MVCNFPHFRASAKRHYGNRCAGAGCESAKPRSERGLSLRSVFNNDVAVNFNVPSKVINPSEAQARRKRNTAGPSRPSGCQLIHGHRLLRQVIGE